MVTETGRVPGSLAGLAYFGQTQSASRNSGITPWQDRSSAHPITASVFP
jgi:hypothetical protein